MLGISKRIAEQVDEGAIAVIIKVRYIMSDQPSYFDHAAFPVGYSSSARSQILEGTDSVAPWMTHRSPVCYLGLPWAAYVLSPEKVGGRTHRPNSGCEVKQVV